MTTAQTRSLLSTSSPQEQGKVPMSSRIISMPWQLTIWWRVAQAYLISLSAQWCLRTLLISYSIRKHSMAQENIQELMTMMHFLWGEYMPIYLLYCCFLIICSNFFQYISMDMMTDNHSWRDVRSHTNIWSVCKWRDHYIWMHWEKERDGAS